MEEQLILHEMFLIYRACAYNFSQKVKGSATAFGAEVEWDDDWYNPAPPKPKELITALDIGKFTGLGYEVES
jgi:hypothetical protein